MQHKYWHITWVSAAQSWTWYRSLCSVNPSVLSLAAPLSVPAALSSIAENAKGMLPWIPLQLFSRIPAAHIIKKKKKIISLICLRPPYLLVCLSCRLHLLACVLACVTSCLSHYLPVCISVCPPASAPLPPLLDLKETWFFFSWEKTEETMIFFFLHCLPSLLLFIFFL